MGPDPSPPVKAEVVSAADLASSRIAVVGFMIATLFATIGVFAGYKAFVVERRKSPAAPALSCSLTTGGAGTAIDCLLTGEATRIGVTDLEVMGDSGQVLLVVAIRDIDVGEAWRWTVLAEHAVRHSTIRLTAVVTDARGIVSDLAVDWKFVGTSPHPVLFRRTWR